MSDWTPGVLGDWLRFRNGGSGSYSEVGSFPVFGANGIYTSSADSNLATAGVVIGRVGSYCGSIHYSPTPAWVSENALIATPHTGKAARFWAYALSSIDLNSWRGGSGQPLLNQSILRNIPFAVPPLPGQQGIAEVLGALDDKIAANTALAARAEELADLTYDSLARAWPRVPMSHVLEPVLGGTPARACAGYWDDGDQLWISARDITSAPSRVIVDTTEKITSAAVSETKARPLPVGSVILTARGTVGEVGRLARPASFNQSCYGFRPDALSPGLLYFSVLRATERAKAVAHGSVFDTITMATFDHLDLAWEPTRAADAESRIAPLLDAISAAVEENRTLAATRDALLPQLMSGKLRVRDAEAAASAVL